MYLSSLGKGRETIIRFSNVKKVFGKKTVLESINFDIYGGEIFGLIGASGAGKTTLLRTLIGFYNPDKGVMLYKGKNITKNKRKIRKIFGFSTQDSCFYDELIVSDNIKYFGEMYGVTGKDLKNKTEQLLKLVELWEFKNQKTANLSGGMKRRLDLAISLVHDPEILILDEPTSGLDPILRKSMWRLIKKVNNLGVTIIMSSHLLEEMEDLCTNVAMLKNGKVLVKGSPDQLKSFYSKNQEVWLQSRPGNYKSLIQHLKNRKISVFYPRLDGDKFVFYTPDTNAILQMLPKAAYDAMERLQEVKIERPNLSEVFEALTKYAK